MSVMPIEDARAPIGRWLALDWLRVLGVTWVVLYHTAQVLSSVAPALWEIAQFGREWRMPLVFAVSGATSAITLRRRPPTRWLRNRLQRLVVPLLFGSSVILPLSLQILSGGSLLPSGAGRAAWVQHFAEMYGRLYDGRHANWAHLWFIAYLSAFAVLLLPLCVRILQPNPVGLAATLLRVTRGRALILVPAVAAGVVACLRDRWTIPLSLFGLIEFKAFAIYLVVYLAGFLVAAAPERWATLITYRRVSMLAGVLTLAVAHLCRAQAADAGPLDRWLLRAADIAVAADAWLAAAALVGYGARYLTIATRPIEWARDVSFPMYFLHQPLLFVLAPAALAWDVDLPTRYLALLALTVGLSLGVQALLSRIGGICPTLIGAGQTVLRSELQPAAPVRAGAIPAWLSVSEIVRARRSAATTFAVDDERSRQRKAS